MSETGIAEGALGKRAVGDSRVVSRLRAGRGLTIDNLDRIRTFMAAERARRAADNGAEARSR